MIYSLSNKLIIGGFIPGVLEMAGKGSYGAVYKARDLKTSELVAIKVISLSEGVCYFVIILM